MKAFLLVLAAAAGLAYYLFYYRAQPPATPPPENGESAKATPATNPRGFDTLTTLLRQDMDGIPDSLDGAGRAPANAVSIKRKIGPHVGEHPEYRTLVQVCDLILQADSQRAAFQQACHSEQTRASFGATLRSGPSLRSSAPDPKAEQAAIRARIEGNWQKQRQQTSSQVQGLLGSLAGRQL